MGMNEKELLKIIKENCILKNTIIQIIEVNEENINAKIDTNVKNYLKHINIFLKDALNIKNSLVTKEQILKNIERFKKKDGQI